MSVCVDAAPVSVSVHAAPVSVCVAVATVFVCVAAASVSGCFAAVTVLMRLQCLFASMPLPWLQSSSNNVILVCPRRPGWT